MDAVITNAETSTPIHFVFVTHSTVQMKQDTLLTHNTRPDPGYMIQDPNLDPHPNMDLFYFGFYRGSVFFIVGFFSLSLSRV